MEISKELQEQKEEAERLFYEAEMAQREFIRMADAEGLPERQIRRRWLVMVDWGMKELNAESWKVTLFENLNDHSPDAEADTATGTAAGTQTAEQAAEELMKEVDEGNLLGVTEDIMVDLQRRLREKTNEFAAICAQQGMSEAEIRQAIEKAHGRELPDKEGDDPDWDDTLE